MNEGPMRRLFSSVAAAGLLALAVALTASPATADDTVPGKAGIAAVRITDSLNCALDLGAYGTAFHGTTGCGTVVLAHGHTYAPAALPVAGTPSDYTAWQHVSQETSGSGSAADPYKIVTTVIGWGIRVTQTDTFAADDSLYSTSIHVENQADQATDLQVYHLAQCAGSTYGEIDGLHVTCRAANGAYSSKLQGVQFSGGRAQLFFGTGADAWATIRAGSTFDGTAGPGTSQAINGVLGISWKSVRLQPVGQTGATADFTMQTTFQRSLLGPPASATPAPATSAAEPEPDPPAANEPAASQPAPSPSQTSFTPYAPLTSAPAATTSSPPAAATSNPPAATAGSGTGGTGGTGTTTSTTGTTTGSRSSTTPSATPTPTPTPSPSVTPTPTASASTVHPTKAPTSPSAELTVAEFPSGDAGESAGEAFLTSPWSFAAVGVLGLGGFASASVLRRHGRPE
jgi:hypothetical protein